ncbi:MAG: DUF2752 domain-containing protein [Verrucomicrobiota bacterium]
MMRAAKPPLLQAGHFRPGPVAPWVFAAMLGAMLVASPFGQRFVPVPLCGMQRVFHLPCPFCGSTRALGAWAQGQWMTAFALNPLTSLAVIGVAIWFLLWLIDRARHTTYASQAFALIFQKRFWPLGALLVTANWLYLLLTLH